MLNTILGKKHFMYQHPRPASSVLILDYDHKPTRVLMGLRQHTHIFLPNTYVFPGGRIDKSDSRLKHFMPHQDQTLDLLQRTTHKRHASLYKQAFGLACIRETLEETGYFIGQFTQYRPRISSQWKNFFQAGMCPDLSILHYIARAVTPTGKPRRYDTCFFAVDAKHIHTTHHPSHIDDEFVNICWLTWEEAINSRISSITKHLLHDVSSLFDSRDNLCQTSHIPFYHQRGKQYIRDIL